MQDSVNLITASIPWLLGLFTLHSLIKAGLTDGYEALRLRNNELEDELDRSQSDYKSHR